MSEFSDAANSRRGSSTAGEIWRFLKQTKKWWLLPLVIAVVLLSVLVFLASTGVAPFIYTLF